MIQVLAILLLLTTSAFAQDKAPSDAKLLASIAVKDNANLASALKSRKDALRIAQLEKENLILTARLILHVPNDWEWDDVTEAFNPPKANEKAKP